MLNIAKQQPGTQSNCLAVGSDLCELLNIEVLFSPEIRDNKEFVAQLTPSLETVYDKGPIAAIKEILDQV